MIYTTVVLVSLIISYVAEKTRKKRYVFLVALLLSLLAGLRSVTIGVDTGNYYRYIENVRVSGIRFGSDIGFSALCNVLLKVLDSPEYLLLIFAIITNFLIIYRCWDFEKKSSFFVMIATYVVLQYPYSLNIVRQFMAIAIVFFASRYIEREKSWIFLVATVLASSIHTSALMGVAYLLIYKSEIKRNSKLKQRYVVILIAIFAFVILMNQFDLDRYFEKYFGNPLTYSFSFLTTYRLLCVLFIIFVSRFFRNSKFTFTNDGNYIRLDKNSSKICMAGLAICAIGMFITYMNRIGFYFIAFEMPFWGQACRATNKTNRHVFRVLLFVMLLYVYISSYNSNDVLNYMTFFSD